ncbi:MAG: class I SAM-dependent methyltransferase [Nitrospiraceae bacterium]
MRHISRALLTVMMSLTLNGPDLSVFAQHGETHQRRPVDVKEYLKDLDRPERDQYQKPSQVVEALRLKPGMAVADVGSGSGYFTRRFARAITDQGKVYAIDVEPDMLAYVKDSFEHMQIPYTAEFVLGEPDNPKLPSDSVDLVFLCNVYHHVEKRIAYFTNLRAALKPEGRLAIIDFYHDERSGDVGFPRRHLVARDTVIDEMTKAGFALIREHTFLPRQYFLEFALPP